MSYGVLSSLPFGLAPFSLLPITEAKEISNMQSTSIMALEMSSRAKNLRRSEMCCHLGHRKWSFVICTKEARLVLTGNDDLWKVRTLPPSPEVEEDLNLELLSYFVLAESRCEGWEPRDTVLTKAEI
jgi:hypothetical protein